MACRGNKSQYTIFLPWDLRNVIKLVLVLEIYLQFGSPCCNTATVRCSFTSTPKVFFLTVQLLPVNTSILIMKSLTSKTDSVRRSELHHDFREGLSIHNHKAESVPTEMYTKCCGWMLRWKRRTYQFLNGHLQEPAG